MIFMKKPNTQSGIVSLFAVVFLTVATTISVGVFTLLIGEFKLAGVQRESVKAFYAADSGIECALYWELRGDSFASTTALNNIECGEGKVEFLDTQTNMGSIDKCTLGVCTNEFTMPLLNNACTEVIVEKQYVGDTLETHIESRGKNDCDNPRVERAADVTIRS